MTDNSEKTYGLGDAGRRTESAATRLVNLNLHYAAAGIVLCICWEWLIGGVPVGQFTIHIGMIGYVCLSLFPGPLIAANRKSLLWKCWNFFAAMALTDLPAMAVRESSLEQNWPAVLACGAAIASLTFAIAGAVLFWMSPNKLIPIRRLEAAIVLFLALVMIGLCQATNARLRAQGVPNEERSVFFFDAELHHINWGIPMVIAIVLLWPVLNSSRVSRILCVAFLGIGFGFFWDEWYYYMLSDVSDDAYFSFSTIVSAVIAGVASIATWLMLLHKINRNR